MYTCCKCTYQWTNWDGKQKKEGPIPKYCPSCKNARWNQRYLEEEIALVDKLQDELYKTNLIRKTDDKTEGSKTLGLKPSTIYDHDFIAYDFLNTILPQPELFEIKQVLAIPKKNVESRHEFMLSIIKDRIANANKYEQERFSKYSKYDGDGRRKIGFDVNALLGHKKYQPSRRRIMNGSTDCKHKPIPEIENKLYPDYDHGSYSRKWIELKEET